MNFMFGCAFLALPGLHFGWSRHYQWKLFLLPRGTKFTNHGVLQKAGTTGCHLLVHIPK